MVAQRLRALSVVALSVILAWLYANAGGSLLVVMLFHATVNNSKDIVPSTSPGAHDVWGFGATRVAWFALATLGACAVLAFTAMARSDAKYREWIVRGR